jgi:hypothetical protein
MRSAKRRCPNETGEALARRRTDHRRGHGIVAIEQWQQTREALGQHRLAAAGTTDQQEIVFARRCHFRGATRDGLAAHIGQVGTPVDIGWGGKRPWFDPRSDSAQGGNHVGERRCDTHALGRCDESICSCGIRNDHVMLTHCGHQRCRSGHRFQ